MTVVLFLVQRDPAFVLVTTVVLVRMLAGLTGVVGERTLGICVSW